MQVDFPVPTSEIVDEFIQYGKTIMLINWDATNRPKESVYVSLIKYLRKFPDLKIEVRRVKGNIYMMYQGANNEKHNVLSG